MQSHNYVPGVSGWKMHSDGRLEVAGTIRVATNLAAVERSQPFIVLDGVTYISETEIARAIVTNAKIEPNWSIKMELRNGQHYAAGIASQLLTSAEKFAIKEDRPKSAIERAVDEGNAQKILDLIAGTISETELGKSLIAEGDPFAERVRAVLRDELRPGGLLHRLNR